MTGFWQLLKAARQAQLSDGNVVISWLDARKLAEEGERLQIEIAELKDSLALCSKVIDREQVKRLREGLASIPAPQA
jgi:hypothetical protein